MIDKLEVSMACFISIFHGESSPTNQPIRYPLIKNTPIPLHPRRVTTMISGLNSTFHHPLDLKSLITIQAFHPRPPVRSDQRKPRVPI